MKGNEPGSTKSPPSGQVTDRVNTRSEAKKGADGDEESQETPIALVFKVEGRRYAGKLPHHCYPSRGSLRGRRHLCPSFSVSIPDTHRDQTELHLLPLTPSPAQTSDEESDNEKSPNQCEESTVAETAALDPFPQPHVTFRLLQQSLIYFQTSKSTPSSRDISRWNSRNPRAHVEHSIAGVGNPCSLNTPRRTCGHRDVTCHTCPNCRDRWREQFPYRE